MKDEISNAWKNIDDDQVPPFSKVWRAAEQRNTAARRSYRIVASAAAVVAAIIVGSSLQSPQEPYVELVDLLESTSWSAPSDVLLPEHQIDIYQDMPMLNESSYLAGGTLL